MNIEPTTHRCPSCNTTFSGHPSAIYCSSTCYSREKRRRRAARRQYKPLKTTDQYEAVYTNPSADELASICQDIIIHVYERDIQLIGTLPTIEIPPDVRINKVPGTNYSIAYHAVRGDYSHLDLA